MPDAVRKRSVRIAGHPTSISLEEPFWDELRRIADARGQSLNALVTAVDAGRAHTNLSSTLRLLVLAELRREAGRGGADDERDALPSRLKGRA